mmetsp:Transcript_123727/g.194077  ORF Transcript_123727/g.194077 Transcript_123727/m.194077 type:complete len:221 (+) Transcript_123727:120-782(+)
MQGRIKAIRRHKEGTSSLYKAAEVPVELKAIDQTTDVPLDLFEQLLAAGKAARQRGQHYIADSGGEKVLRHPVDNCKSPIVATLRSSSSMPASTSSTNRKQSSPDFALDPLAPSTTSSTIPRIELRLPCRSEKPRAASARRALAPPKLSIAHRVIEKSVEKMSSLISISSRSNTSNATPIHDDTRVAVGSGRVAASTLRQSQKNWSVPLRRKSDEGRASY